jgi:hypothetical protein
VSFVRKDAIIFCLENVLCVCLSKLELGFDSCRSTVLLYAYVVILIGLSLDDCNRLI